MNRKTMRNVAIAMALSGASIGLSGCGALQDSQVFQADFWTFGGGGPSENTLAELGLGELAKGNNVQAQGHFQNALKANPNDVHALYGLAVLYQNTGQPTRARQLYEQILALDPRPTDEILIWADKQTQPIVDIAQVNMVRLENGQPAAMPGAPMPGQMGGQAGGQMTGQTSAQAAPAPQAMPQSQLYVQPRGALGQPQAMSPQGMQNQQGQPLYQQADLNIVKRFEALRALLDQGLITQEEFVQRRTANVGALLPQTSRPPATGLDRPVPSVDQISGRLRAIGRALEMRALSPAQHMAERSMILDALMPAKPASVQNPPPPPKGLMEAADAVRRLEMLKSADLITSDEYAKERAAIEGSMQPSPGTMPAEPAMASGGGGASQTMTPSGGQPKLSGFQPGVHLASYRREADARKGWAQLQKKFGALAGMAPHIERVDLGGSKGVFFRLKAGPLPSNGAAQDLCRQLKSQRQYCEPTTVNLG